MRRASRSCGGAGWGRGRRGWGWTAERGRAGGMPQDGRKGGASSVLSPFCMPQELLSYVGTVQDTVLGVGAAGLMEEGPSEGSIIGTSDDS